jgi:[acyl-carrier-protein] S-malonyltransferase
MKNTAFLFPGQASQYVGMGKKLFDQHDEVKVIFEEASDLLDFDIANLCFEGSLEELSKTANTQPALLVCSFAAFTVFKKQFDIQPIFCAGHSIGEISALTAVGAIKFSDAVQIVRQRGLYMQEAVGLGLGKMAAISSQLSQETIQEICLELSTNEDKIVISNLNSPNQIVISGLKSGVERVSERLSKMGATVFPLKVSAPFHSPYMQEAADNLRKDLGRYQYHPFQYPVISNINAEPYINPDLIIDNLSTQMVEPVKWADTIQYLKNHGIDTVVELGPKSVLKGMMKDNYPACHSFSFDVEDDVKKLIQHSKSKEIIKDNIALTGSLLMSRCMAVAVATKNINWNEDEYQKGVVVPYKAVQEALNLLEQTNTQPSHEQMEGALEMLKSVFKTKKTPIEERKQRFSQIFVQTNTTNLFQNYSVE